MNQEVKITTLTFHGEFNKIFQIKINLVASGNITKGLMYSMPDKKFEKKLLFQAVVSIQDLMHVYYNRFPSVQIVSLQEKKEENWLGPMTKALTPTEKSKKQYDNTKTPPKT